MTQTIVAAPGEATAPPIRALPTLDRRTFCEIRRRLLLDHCKWDPQVGDVSMPAPFALVLDATEWRRLAGWAERLSAEAFAAEAELLRRPDLHRLLALPRALRRMMRSSPHLAAGRGLPRVMRFDFHWSDTGWRISECNSDVPGGFAESSALPALMAQAYGNYRTAGDPGGAWADALARAGGQGSAIALVSAAGYMEDQQVTAYLARRLRRRGITPYLCDPSQLEWRGGSAFVPWHHQPLGCVVRFYQAEWLARSRRTRGGSDLLLGGVAPVINPAAAAFIESKRFPLAWPLLRTPLPTWRQLLPDTRDTRDAPWRRDDSWLLKSAFCNTGDDVGIRSSLPPRQWRRFAWKATCQPGQWVAQRRFMPVPIETPIGPMNVCVGVYTVDGQAVGIYGRATRGAVIDYAAVDVAVLVSNRSEPREGRKLTDDQTRDLCIVGA